ncbi:annexin D4 isoform X1 [Rhodamnia argentea]|uniref:Annexin D4 isoform X1 n=1 Tax=Rhodamnia argentea TaxID=178133 RepID=A0ABM3HF44_9MYRT|nr:annexin D4 isoform X1 [Rhodamnia argentea]
MRILIRSCSVIVSMFFRFAGHGVDERTLITVLGKSHPEKRKSFRKATPHFFKEDERSFERWDDHRIKLLKQEFMRFKNAVVLWAMHPWERDARLMKESLTEGPDSYNVLIEVACTRSSEELLGARRAYHSLFDHSIEEEVASHVHDPERKLLVALVSAYRYEGSNLKEDIAKSEAKILLNAIKSSEKKTQDEEVIRILATRSKPHLKAVYKDYQEISGSTLDEDLKCDLRLQETVQCLCTPERYFSQVLDLALRTDSDKSTKKALTRVIVTRADVDVKEIDEEFNKLYGVPLSKKIEDTANGNYKDFLLTLIAKGD